MSRRPRSPRASATAPSSRPTQGDVYHGTLTDRALLLAEGYLDAEDDFEVLTEAEVREQFAWIHVRARYNAWWDGFNLATATATVTAAAPKLSLLQRIASRLWQ